MAKSNSAAGISNSSGAKGTPVAIAQTHRAANSGVSVELAKYRGLPDWKPKVGDFIIWHGWFTRWYGVISGFDGGDAIIIKENLPKLLFTLSNSEYGKNSVKIPIVAIIRSRGGEYHVMQDGVWFVDD